jgi:hypothetical protein
MQYFQNAQAYFATVVNYARKFVYEIDTSTINVLSMGYDRNLQS